MALAPIRLVGETRCELRRDEALSLVLQGTEAPAPGREAAAVEVGFTSPQPPGLAVSLRNVLIEELAPRPETGGAHPLRRFAITTDAQPRFELEARSVHVHRDARAAFFAAVPPRRAPLARRVFFDLLPALVATRFGRRLLRRLRGS